MIPYRPVMSGQIICKPRASGDDPRYIHNRHLPKPVNPARAGMIRASLCVVGGAGSKPRASGDDPHILSVVETYDR